jgi:hypothetical protein
MHSNDDGDLQLYRGMLSYGMLCHMVLVRTDVLEEWIASIISVTRICELGTALAITSNQIMVRRNTIL